MVYGLWLLLGVLATAAAAADKPSASVGWGLTQTKRENTGSRRNEGRVMNGWKIRFPCFASFPRSLFRCLCYAVLVWRRGVDLMFRLGYEADKVGGKEMVEGALLGDRFVGCDGGSVGVWYG